MALKPSLKTSDVLCFPSVCVFLQQYYNQTFQVLSSWWWRWWKVGLLSSCKLDVLQCKLLPCGRLKPQWAPGTRCLGVLQTYLRCLLASCSYTLVTVDQAANTFLLAGSQISCFPPTNFTLRQAVYVDSFCWVAAGSQTTEDGSPLWLHKVMECQTLNSKPVL